MSLRARRAAALDLTLALGPFDTFPEIMCERGASEGERLYSTHLENEFDAPIGMREKIELLRAPQNIFIRMGGGAKSQKKSNRALDTCSDKMSQRN